MSAGVGDLTAKLFVVPLLAFALVLTLFCPCQRLLCCHLPHIWTALGLTALGIVWANGGLKFYDAECAAAAKAALAATTASS
jgi:hypothetical protein